MANRSAHAAVPLPLLGAMLLLLVSALLPTPAQADVAFRQSSTTLDVQAPTRTITVRTSSCDTPVRYTVHSGMLPADGHYDLTVTLRNKHGQRVGTDDDYYVEDTTYRGQIIPGCGKKLVSGKYTLTAKAVVYDANYDRVEALTATTKVRLHVVRPVPTRLVVTKIPYGSRGWRWTGRLTTLAGKPVVGRRINLWWDLFGWDDYGVSKRTDRLGYGRWVSNPDGALGGINFQLRFGGDDSYGPSRSRVFDIAPR